MHVRRLAAFALGAWLACAPLIALAALHNFDSVARIMAWPPPQAARSLSILGPADSRALLRYQVYEMNGSYFEVCQWAQLALGVLLLVIFLFGYRAARLPLVLLSLMLVLEAASIFYVVPELQRLGRIVSFLPPAAAETAAFRKYTVAYVVLEAAGWIAGFFLATLLIRRSHTTPAARIAPSKSKWVRA